MVQAQCPHPRLAHSEAQSVTRPHSTSLPEVPMGYRVSLQLQQGLSTGGLQLYAHLLGMPSERSASKMSSGIWTGPE